MRGEALGDGLGDALGDTFGEAFGVPFGDLDLYLFLSLVFSLLESNCFASSSALIKISFSLSGESGVEAAVSVPVRSCVDLKGLKLTSR